jgi:hypothetical protein
LLRKIYNIYGVIKALNICTTCPTVIVMSLYNLVPSVLDATFSYITRIAHSNPHIAAEKPVIRHIYWKALHQENYIMRSFMICTPHPILCG